ncbi:MAG: TetR/AcrR family transcriptional regulator [Planctomycetota bacterium]
MGNQSDGALSRKERERRGHRRLILEAAEDLFAQNGYHETSMQQIADAAEFSVGSLYNMFEGKEQLYHELVEMRAEQYLQEVDRRLEEEAGPLEKLRCVVRCKLEFFDRHRQFFRIFANFAAGSEGGPAPMLSVECMETYAQYQEELAGVFTAGTRQGVFREFDPGLGVLALEGITNAIIGRWVHTGEKELESVSPEAVEQILLRGLLAGDEG